MASKRRIRRRACTGKVQHTKDSAFNAALSLRKRTSERVDAYPCEFGDHWHVGHRPKKVQQSISARRKAAG